MTTPHDPTAATEEADAAAAKSSRARWSDAQCAAIMARRDPDSSVVILLKALRACNIAHKTIDITLGAPAGTTMKYLRTARPQAYTVDGVEKLLDDAAADAVVENLAMLKLSGAFTARGLDLSAVLRLMLDKGLTIS